MERICEAKDVYWSGGGAASLSTGDSPGVHPVGKYAPIYLDTPGVHPVRGGGTASLSTGDSPGVQPVGRSAPSICTIGNGVEVYLGSILLDVINVRIYIIF